MDIKAKLARSLHCEERALLFIHVYVVATIKKNETRSSMTRSKTGLKQLGNTTQNYKILVYGMTRKGKFSESEGRLRLFNIELSARK